MQPQTLVYAALKGWVYAAKGSGMQPPTCLFSVAPPTNEDRSAKEVARVDMAPNAMEDLQGAGRKRSRKEQDKEHERAKAQSMKDESSKEIKGSQSRLHLKLRVLISKADAKNL